MGAWWNLSGSLDRRLSGTLMDPLWQPQWAPWWSFDRVFIGALVEPWLETWWDPSWIIGILIGTLLFDDHSSNFVDLRLPVHYLLIWEMMIGLQSPLRFTEQLFWDYRLLTRHSEVFQGWQNMCSIFNEVSPSRVEHEVQEVLGQSFRPDGPYDVSPLLSVSSTPQSPRARATNSSCAFAAAELALDECWTQMEVWLFSPASGLVQVRVRTTSL